MSRLLPLGLILLFFGISFCPLVQRSESLVHAFWWTTGALLVLYGATLARIARGGAAPALQMAISRTHYVQATLQFSIYCYWGWYWDPVIQQSPLIFSQLVLLYALGALVAWVRGRVWRVGFGPFPICFSVNLLLWFADPWFLLQFAMIALTVVGKEFIQWTRDGERTHIFNPAAFALVFASVLLIATGTSEITRGGEISRALDLPQHIFLWVFALGLVVQFLFDVTLVTLAAAMTIMALGALYLQANGIYFFYVPDIPIAIFIGLHLLVTDPATSPRTGLGRVIFGVLYGIGVMVSFDWLDLAAIPAFYDKLLPVPLLNLSVRHLDRWTEGIDLSRWRPAFLANGLPLGLGRRLDMLLWVVLFTSFAGFGHFAHVESTELFTYWQKACLEEEVPRGCTRFNTLMWQICTERVPEGCANLAYTTARGLGTERDPVRAYELIRQACALDFEPACREVDNYKPLRFR